MKKEIPWYVAQEANKHLLVPMSHVVLLTKISFVIAGEKYGIQIKQPIFKDKGVWE